MDKMERLPRYLQDRWIRDLKTLDRFGRYPNVLNLVEFLNTVAIEANDPVFGVLEDRTKDSGKSQSTPANFNVQASQFQ